MELVRDWRMRTDARMTADELALGMRGMLGALADQVTGVSALSTVPAVLRELRVMLGRYYGDVPRIVVQPGVRTGVPLLVDNPREVGGDRVMNTLAAHHLYGTACVVVDFGTVHQHRRVLGQGRVPRRRVPGRAWRSPSRRWPSAARSCARWRWSGRGR